MQKHLKRVLDSSDENEPRREALRQVARDIGANPRFGVGQVETYPEEESILIERIQTAARTHRDGIAWLIAFITTMAAILSALAALIGVLT